MEITQVPFIQEAKLLKVINWRDALKDAILDPAVNIKIASLGGDSTTMMGITELQPGAKIRAHLHTKDAEIYYILNGTGEMYTGFQEGKSVRWNVPVMVKDGDIFTIHPRMIHQLKNTSHDQPLTLIFSTPLSHLEGDRIVINDYDADLLNPSNKA